MYVRSSDAARVLVEFGADVLFTNKDGLTPLKVAARHARLSVIEFLLAHGADASARGDEGSLSAVEIAEQEFRDWHTTPEDGRGTYWEDILDEKERWESSRCSPIY